MTAKTRTSPADLPESETLLADPRWRMAGRIASSPCLSRANQLRDILLYIVRQNVLVPDNPIREAEIAHKVLGRRSDFNPLDDNIVRVQMAHLRKKLETYFAEDGRDELMTLTIALGSYKPIFAPRTKPLDPALKPTELPPPTDSALPRPVETEPVPAYVPTSTVQPATTGSRLATKILGGIAFLSVAASLVLGVLAYRQHQQLSDLRKELAPWQATPAVAALWASFFNSPHDTDLVIGDDALLLIEQLTKKYTTFNDYLNRSYLPPASDTSDHTALHLVASKGLGSTSEFKLAQRILSQAPLNRQVHLYGARQYIPSLLRQNNVILIGGKISNPWEGVFDEKLNFSEGMKFIDVGVSHVTNNKPQGNEPKEWLATYVVGYCVIAYMPNQSDGRNVLLLEGTNSEATEAAGDFLLSEQQLSAFLKTMGRTTFPPFEVLLKISQVKGTPLTATIEAYRAY